MALGTACGADSSNKDLVISCGNNFGSIDIFF